MLGEMKEQSTVADLFYGAGGLSVGLQAAGFRIVHAADCDAAAAQSYRLNFPHGSALESLRWNSTLPNADIIVGGPPCQGFSSAGKRSPSWPRRTSISRLSSSFERHSEHGSHENHNSGYDEDVYEYR